MRDEEFIEISPTIKKRIIKKGRYGRKPSLGWTCGVQLRFDNSNEDESKDVTIGDGCNPEERSLELCIETMQLEEESAFKIQIDPQNTNYVVIKLNFYKEKPYIFEWSDEEKMEASKMYKAKGADLFKDSKIEEAFYKFSLALKLTTLLDSVLEQDELDPNVSNLRIALYNNLASCHLHFKNYTSVIKLCCDSIAISTTSKALYRRALAYIELKNYEEAENDLGELLKLDPKNKAALDKYKLVRELNRTSRENYELMVKKMFQ